MTREQRRTIASTVTANGPFDRLVALGTIGERHAGEAAELLAQARTTADESRAIEFLLKQHTRERLPESLLLPLAALLVDRGETAVAESVLAHSSSRPAFLLRADLLARAGNLRSAIALVERILLWDFDFPGARERHTRWCGILGRGARVTGTGHVGAELAPPPVKARSLPFHLLREVGRGAAAAVFEARDPELGRTVALKVYHHPGSDRGQLALEARVAVLLAGPGVVGVFDLDFENGWLAMQWAPGGALTARLGTQPMAPASEMALAQHLSNWSLALATALARIHAAGWAHLDVKPANVLLDARQGVMLSDFGLARRFGESSPAGSLGYESPERLANAPTSAADDVYGFGRMIEDALDIDPAGAKCSAWRELAAVCTGPAASRPQTGGELVAKVAATRAANEPNPRL